MKKTCNYIKFHFSLILAIIPFFSLTAQDIEYEDEIEGIVNLKQIDSLIGFLPESLDDDMHKLLEGWHARHFFNPEDYCEDGDENPFFSDSVYRMRLRNMPTVVPMTYNETVRRCIDLYSGRRLNFTTFPVIWTLFLQLLHFCHIRFPAPLCHCPAAFANSPPSPP